jgi:hypothetical protein
MPTIPSRVKRLKGDEVVPFNTGKEPWFAPIAKHYGPGTHPGTGTEQTVHGSPRVHVGRGKGRRGRPVDKFLVRADGSELPNSFDALDEAYVMIDGEIEGTNRGTEIKQAILDAVKAQGLDPSHIDRNLTRIMESALARYADNPDLVTQDRFYDAWHEALYNIAQDTDTDLSRTIAAAAIISANQPASANLHYASDLAHYLAEDVTWEGQDAQAILAELDRAQADILDPVYKNRHVDVVRGLVQEGDSRPAPEEGSFRWQQGQTLKADFERLRNNKSFSVSDLDSYSAAYALHVHRSRTGGYDLPADTPAVFVGKKPQNGFGVTNFAFYGEAVSVLRGEITPSQALGDVKVRSFHNNILDPTDSLGFNDVTVDYHAADSAFFTTGMRTEQGGSPLLSSPKLEGVSVGIRPLVADGIRRIAARHKVGGESLSGGRAQEILWIEWSRGLMEKREVPASEVPEWAKSAGPRTVTHWQAFDGTLYPLTQIQS